LIYQSVLSKQQTKFSNGEAVIQNCIFCGATFDTPSKIGEKITCPEEQGGCGNSYRVSMYQEPAIKQEGN
jgi:hypothetical protein